MKHLNVLDFFCFEEVAKSIDFNLFLDRVPRVIDLRRGGGGSLWMTET